MLASCLSLSLFPACFSPEGKIILDANLATLKQSALSPRQSPDPSRQEAPLPREEAVLSPQLPCSWLLTPPTLVLHLYCTDLLIPVISHTVLFPPPASALLFPLAPLPAPLCSLIQPRPLLLQEAFPDYPPPFFLPSLGSGTLLCAHISPSTHHPSCLVLCVCSQACPRSHWICRHLAKRLAGCLALCADLSDTASPETQPTETLGR